MIDDAIEAARLLPEFIWRMDKGGMPANAQEIPLHF
jgi:hypothetical protein